ncbi:MAG: crossover junction endodeoxyribonuclease RuvC [Epsilonproteobacteria bacterium]|nr:crossover junction endodeoxyribonuclease RuvC [Campylobacterota bacterium]
MKILGIDPGSRMLGIALMNGEEIDLRVLKIDSSLSILDKLKKIYDEISLIINEEKPDALAIENAFLAKNPHVAFILGHVRSSVLMAALNLNTKIYEYNPTEVKKELTGYGRATKQQVKTMLEKILNIEIGDLPFDASDALAVAWCHSCMFDRRIKDV